MVGRKRLTYHARNANINKDSTQSGGGRLDLFVIGAGFAGATVARVFADNNKKVRICDRRSHVAGNMFDCEDDGVLVHKYGPHIFHTSHARVYDYIKNFAELNVYEHKVRGCIDGKLCPIPFNFESIDTCFPLEKAAVFKRKLLEAYTSRDTVAIGELRSGEDPVLCELAEFVYQKVFLNYTKKQWGVPPEELGGDVMSRVPLRLSYDDRYFSDIYQVMPKKGYTHLISSMLDHPNIEVLLGYDAEEHCSAQNQTFLIDGEETAAEVVYTGCLDELLDYRFGVLPYRSLDFLFEKKQWQFQPFSVINYPNDNLFTRSTEFAHFYPERTYTDSTVLYEFPKPYRKNLGDPYYPIPKDENFALYRQYLDEVKDIKNLHLLGRLAQYKYMNMDEVILRGLELADSLLARKLY